MDESRQPNPSSGHKVPEGGTAGFGRTVLIVAGKDLASEFRSREALGGMLAFAVLTLLIFNFALELEVHARASLATGILWLALAFTGTLGLSRSMATENDQGCLDGLLLAPVGRSAIFFGKALANLIVMLLLAAILLPLVSALFNINLVRPGLLGVTLLGSVGYVTVGTLLAAMAVQARTRDLLLPILLFPLAIPVLLAAVRASRGLLEGVPGAEVRPWLDLLIAFDVIFLAAAWMAFEHLGEA